MTALIGGQAALFSNVSQAPELRAYQAQDVAALLACVMRGRSALYCLPTGGGKSVVLGAVSRRLSEQGFEVWIFAHRRELIRQMSEHLRAAGVTHGIIAPDQPLTCDAIQVCSIDTVRARFALLRKRLERVRVIVIDEAHHSASGSYQLIIQAATNAVLLGVTATPFRYDGKPLGDMYAQGVRGPTAAELEAMGYLAPVKIIAPPVNIDVSRVRKSMGDFVASQLEKVVNTEEVTRAAIYQYGLHCAGIPTIAYCTTVKHGEDCAQAFTAAGWRVELIEGKMSKSDRDRAISGLASGRHQILFSIDCVSEGTDVPVVGAGISLRPTQSTGLYLQQIGRIRRIYPGKTDAIWLDLVGNWARHGMPNAERPWTLEGGVRGLERAVEAVRRCGRCHHVTQRGPERCPNCDRKFMVRAAHSAPIAEAAISILPGFAGLPAERIAAAKLAVLLPLAKTESDLRSIAAIKGYKPGWVAFVLSERARNIRKYA